MAHLFMTCTEITDIILDEIKGGFERSNFHGVNLKKALLTPVKQKYISAQDNSISFELWTVLEETEDQSGYTIFYDAEERNFGLGMKSEDNKLLYLGNYGSFLETLNAM